MSSRPSPRPGGRAWAVAADLRFPAVASELLAQAESIASPLDILVNNAAHAPTSLLAECSDEEFASTMTVNVMSPFMLMRDAARRMRDGGRIINISTLNTVLISPGTTAYAASKAALELMTRVAAASSAAAASRSTRCPPAPPTPTCSAPRTRPRAPMSGSRR